MSRSGMSRSEVKACKACQSSKRKCTKQQPRCRRCELRGLDCIYEPLPNTFLYQAPQSHAVQTRPTDNFTETRSLNSGQDASSGALVGTEMSTHANEQNPESTLSLEDLKLAWFLDPDSLRAVPIAQSNRAHLTTDMVQGLLYQTRDWLSDWIRTGSNVFVHHELYKHTLPDCIADAFATMSAYLSRTAETNEVVLRITEQKAEKLVQRVEIVQDSRTILDSLSSVQALLVYCTIRLLDDWTNDMMSDTFEATTSGDIIMQNHLSNQHPQYLTLPMLLGQFSPEQLLWHAWILAESVRRTWCVSMGLQSGYELLKTESGPCYGTLPITTRKGLWGAKSAFTWIKMCAETHVGFMCRNDHEKVMKDMAPGEIDEFALAFIMARQWILDDQQGFEASLKYEDNVPIPKKEELGPNEVLVKLHAASLNYRDVVIAASAQFGPITPPMIPLCDGTGSVEAVGSSVKDYKPGDRVITFPAPDVVSQRGGDADVNMSDVPTMLGLGTKGTLRTYGAFSENALVHAPKSLDWLQSATLPVTWVTAWNALSELSKDQIGPQTWILVQGTGGVSVAMLQLASSLGLTVVATTSTQEKAEKLKSLGATHVVNYRENPTAWGKEARDLTPNGAGFDMIVDIGGNETLKQSLEAVRPYGSIQVVGAVAQDAEVVPMMGALMYTCTIRGFLMGSQNQYKELVRYIDEKKLQPVYDDTVFELADAKDAYRKLKEQKHFAKVVIRIDHGNI
ncbi:alcohol dehydrogenase [Fusarium beomiforme]|uniref:Alcohol dehydrogenase n=1 Tax=Fusarium beomiforme TaxID=44412 RepID=A0A9P5A7B0_9HYPO|nr:alcohol dehydrogenase [Fusarium beomiforme]